MKLSDEYLKGWTDGKKEERERINNTRTSMYHNKNKCFLCNCKLTKEEITEGDCCNKCWKERSTSLNAEEAKS